MSRILMISSDCHAGALPDTYKAYMDKEFHQAADDWWLKYAREMMVRMGTFFDQEAVEDIASKVEHQGTGKFEHDALARASRATDEELHNFLCDPNSMIAPRPGEYDAAIRLKDLEDDGLAAEVVFPQMPPFGGGLVQYRNRANPINNLAGNRAYNRWLADMCSATGGRSAGVALITVDDIDEAVRDVRDAHEMGLFGGVLLPVSTNEQPFYHHYNRYAPLWSVCEELDMPVHTHSGWSPDYGDVPAATPMYISEVDMWAQRPFKALLWSGAFERHPGLKLVLTETGCSWVLETLRVLEYKAENPLFAHFKKGLSLSPTEYFQRNCYIGASFMPRMDVEKRHEMGLDKLMWGSDYPHMEGTWPNTMEKLRESFHDVPEAELRAMLGTNAAQVFGFDLQKLDPIAQRIGPKVSEINGQTCPGVC